MRQCLLLFRFCFLILINTGIFGHASRTFCSVDHTALTCYFNEDLKERSKSFCLYRHNNNQEDTPLACNWKESRPSCTVKPGFSPPENVSDEFTIALPAGSAGTYYCDTIPPGPKVTTCRFEESGLQETTTSRPDSSGKGNYRTKQPDTCRCQEEAAKLVAIVLSLFLLLSAILSSACYLFGEKYRVSTFACQRKGLCGYSCAEKRSGAVPAIVVYGEDGPGLEELQAEKMHNAEISSETVHPSTSNDVLQTENEVSREPRQNGDTSKMANSPINKAEKSIVQKQPTDSRSNNKPDPFWDTFFMAPADV